MTASTLITDYLGRGLIADRPAAPNVPAGGIALYYATDDLSLTTWNGSAWITESAPGVFTFNTRAGNVTLSSADVTGALGYTPGSGSGTVTAITAGQGLSGATITNSGTIALTSIAANSFLGNSDTISAIPAPVFVGPGLLMTAGTIVNTGALTFNTRTGDITLTGGDVTGALGFTPGPGSGSVTSITAGIGLSGGVISISGTIALDAIAAGSLLGNSGTSADVPGAVAIGAGLTLAGGTLSGSGVVSFNTRTGAITLTSGDVTGALGFTPGTGAGSVTSITAGTGLSGGTITGAGTIANAGVLSFNTRTGAVTLTSGDVTGALGYTPLSTGGGTITGNVEITSGNTLTLDAGAVAVLAGNVSSSGTLTNSGTITGGTLAGSITLAATGTLTLSGTTTGVTAAIGDNSTTLATTAFAYKMARGGTSSVITTGGTITLTPAQYGTPNIKVTGALTSNLVLNAPNTQSGRWNVLNLSTGAFSTTIKTASGAGVTIPQGFATDVSSDNTTVTYANTAIVGVALFGTITNSGTISGGTLAGTITNGGTITGGTLAGSITNAGTISGGTYAGAITQSGTITMSGSLNATGALTATTATAGDSTTKAATTAFVQAAKRYIVAVQMVGAQTSATQLLAVHRFGAAGTFPANFGAIASGEVSAGGSTVNATASTVFTIQQCPAASDPTSGGSWTTIGTATLAAAGHAATLATTSGTSKAYVAGDWLRVLGPGTADATAANLALTLVGAG